MKLTIRNKLISGYLYLLILMAIVAAIGAVSLLTLQRDARKAAVMNRLNSMALSIQVHTLEARRNVASYLATGGAAGPVDTSRFLNSAGSELGEAESLAAGAIALAPDAAHRVRFAAIAASIVECRRSLEAISGSAPERTAAASRFEDAADALRRTAREGEATGQDSGDALDAEIEHTNQLAKSVTIGVSLFGLFLGIAMSIALERAILRPVDHLRTVAENVSMGNLQVAVKRFSDDEIGDLTDSFARMLTAVKYFRMDAEEARSQVLYPQGGAL